MTVRQQFFVKEYVNSRNATQAYIKAGYKPTNAHTNASKLLQNTEIKAAIDREFKLIVSKYEYTEADVFKGLGTIAENGKVESNRVRCWELIGKALGLFKEQNINIAVFNDLDKAKISNLKAALRHS